MRMSRDALIEMYPYWNEERHDIVKAFYGDIPVVKWNSAEHDRFCKLGATLANLMAVDAYIWVQNGDYYIYRVLIGDIKVKISGEVLCGSLDVKYGGKVYNIFLNLMYGKKALSIFRNSGGLLTGFSNRDGMMSPNIKNHTSELDEAVIEKVLQVDLSDYGDSVRDFMGAVKSLYYENTSNFILEKTFDK